VFQRVRPHPEEAANGSRECAPDDRLRAVSKDGPQYRFVIPGTRRLSVMAHLPYEPIESCGTRKKVPFPCSKLNTRQLQPHLLPEAPFGGSGVPFSAGLQAQAGTGNVRFKIERECQSTLLPFLAAIISRREVGSGGLMWFGIRSLAVKL
jgi:hypothetical protein